MITRFPRLGALQALAVSGTKAFVATFFKPLPPTPMAVFNLLQFMESEGAMILDGDPAEARWEAELRDATRRGYVSRGGEWSVGPA